MMNNFERMESVQQSLEQLASAKGTEAKVDDNAQVNDQRVNGENENQINAQSEGQNYSSLRHLLPVPPPQEAHWSHIIILNSDSAP